MGAIKNPKLASLLEMKMDGLCRFAPLEIRNPKGLAPAARICVRPIWRLTRLGRLTLRAALRQSSPLGWRARA